MSSTELELLRETERKLRQALELKDRLYNAAINEIMLEHCCTRSDAESSIRKRAAEMSPEKLKAESWEDAY